MGRGKIFQLLFFMVHFIFLTGRGRVGTPGYITVFKFYFPEVRNIAGKRRDSFSQLPYSRQYATAVIQLSRKLATAAIKRQLDAAVIQKEAGSSYSKKGSWLQLLFRRKLAPAFI